MNAHEARREFEAGRLSTAQVLDLVERQQQLLQYIRAERQRLLSRLAHYEPNRLPHRAARGAASPATAAQQRTPGGADNRAMSNEGNAAPRRLPAVADNGTVTRNAAFSRGDTPNDH